MVGRLSTFAKNRILNLRFQKNIKITEIARILEQEDKIKVSRESVSAFLKKYNETKSIHDKPRPGIYIEFVEKFLVKIYLFFLIFISGRRKKLSNEEIELIGQLTRLNREITAPKIKEFLNLNVSSYTILRASKLFEWNKINPNSNEAKKAAALERQSKGEKKRKIYPKKKNDINEHQQLVENEIVELISGTKKKEKISTNKKQNSHNFRWKERFKSFK
jgi:hypothetical protein